LHSHQRQAAVCEILENLSGLEPLKKLFWSELNYDRANQELSRRKWPETQASALAEDPLLLACAGSGENFHVIYGRLASSRLLLTKERPVISRLLKDHPYALFVFSNKTQDKWHFVNVKYDRDRRKTDDDKKRHLLRRITIGPEERLRTASERISMLDLASICVDVSALSPLNIQARHDEAFDVEAVTKKFFDEFKAHFETLQNSLRSQTRDPAWAHEYALLFLSRVMFLYFVQRKEWLGEDTKFLATFWKAYQGSKQPPDSFFDRWLKVLFFEAFNDKFHGGHKHFPDDIREALATAPYLNGGLFTQRDLDIKHDFTIKDKLFKSIFDFLESYNFTIAEDTPLDQEVAVDPEMIGKVYESLVNIGTEEDIRGDAGIFYTPRLEIDLMCRLALVDYLSNHLGEEHKSMLYEAVFALDEEEKRQADKCLLDAGLWPQVNELVKSVKVVDPACGSGSFLVGMMLVLADLRQRAQEQLGTTEGIALDRYRLKEHIIRENLYGVDVMEWAVHIAELRLWLQLVVDAELPFEQRKLQPLLPNLSFKVRQGDSLVQEVGGIDLSRIRGRTELPGDMRGRLTRLLKMKRAYFRGDSSLTPEEIKHEERRFFHDLLFSQEKNLRDRAKRKRAGQLRLADTEASKKEQVAAKQVEAEIAALEKEAEQVCRVRQELTGMPEVPFVWDMAFAEVFESERRGFDIVIGNPPYVRQEKIAPPKGYAASSAEERKHYKRKLIESVAALYPYFEQRHGRLGAKNDLYVYFYFHGLSLLNPKGSFCFVTSNSWLDVGYGKDLQDFLLRHGHVKLIIDNQVKRSFSQADVNTIIALLGAPPDDSNEDGLQKQARFVMFTRPFEDVFHPVVFEEIQEAEGRKTMADYRVMVLSQDQMLKAGMEPPKESKKGKGPFVHMSRYGGDKWGGKYLRAPDIYWTILEKGRDKLVRLGDIAEVRRGITTGCNEFFYLPSKHFDIQPEGDYYRLIPKHEGLPDDLLIESTFLQPVIFSLKEIQCIEDDLSACRHKMLRCHRDMNALRGTRVAAYIRWGETQGFHSRPTCAARLVWYSLGERWEPAPFVFPAKVGQRMLVLRNRQGHLEDKKLYGVRPFDKQSVYWSAALNSTLCRFFMDLSCRQLTGAQAIADIDVDVVEDILLPTSESVDAAALQSPYRALARRPILPHVRDEYARPDRRALDDVFFDTLGLTQGEREAVYEAVIGLVEARLKKADSVG